MKSTDCLVDLNRKSNTDYTTAKNDDDKNLSEKSNSITAAANLFVDMLKNKRDQSPTTICQNNVDKIVVNESMADNSRINTDNNTAANKKNENHYNGAIVIQSEVNNASKRQQKTICYDFKKGTCRRRFCRVSCCFFIPFRGQFWTMSV